jgi:hypothetical protein
MSNTFPAPATLSKSLSLGLDDMEIIKGTALAEIMLRNRLVISFCPNTSFVARDKARREMLDWLEINATGFYHEKLGNSASRETILFENDSDIVLFTLRFESVS